MGWPRLHLWPSGRCVCLRVWVSVCPRASRSVGAPLPVRVTLPTSIRWEICQKPKKIRQFKDAKEGNKTAAVGILHKVRKIKLTEPHCGLELWRKGHKHYCFLWGRTAQAAYTVHSSCLAYYTYIHTLARPPHNKYCLVLSLAGLLNANSHNCIWNEETVRSKTDYLWPIAVKKQTGELS